MRRVSLLRHVVTASRRASTARVPRPPPSSPRKYKPIPIVPGQPVPEPAPPKTDDSAFSRSRRVPWTLALITATVIGFYSVNILIAANQPCHNPHIADLAQQKDVAGRYDYTADSFDSEVGLSEVLMMVNSLRKQLARKCTGHVLEVSCGTGRNLGYYDLRPGGRIDSLTFVDLSPQMVEACKKKWSAFFGSDGEQGKLKPGLAIRFLTGSALTPMPLAPSGEKYTTIIQTMGLCSTASPTALLTNMATHLDTSDPDARILLLEHGRSYLPWLNNILDNAAEKHAELHGCWFNRNIGALVEEAAREAGLEVARERRYHFGTTWLFELKPTAQTAREAKSSSSPSAVVANDEKTEKQGDGTAKSWFGWSSPK